MATNICCNNPDQNHRLAFRCENCGKYSHRIHGVDPNWGLDGTLIYYMSYEMFRKADPIKVAAFDLDSTLVITKTGRKFPRDGNDWQLLNEEAVLNCLKRLVEDDYFLVIFSNQNGISKGRVTVKAVIDRISYMMTHIKEKIGVNFYGVYLATEDDLYRKPAKGMWKYFRTRIGENTIDMKSSFFCGDAAGRKRGWKEGAGSDFSCSDRKFAKNIGISFKIPEELFFDEPAPNYRMIDWGFRPDKYLEEIKNNPPDMDMSAFANRSNLDHNTTNEATNETINDTTDNTTNNTTNEENDSNNTESNNNELGQGEMIILIGPPASGKSTFVKNYLNDYRWISQDRLKTKKKCIQLATDLIQKGDSIVIDNTNPDRNTREPYIKIALKSNVPVRAVVFETNIELAKHLNVYREKLGIKKKVPALCYNIFKKRFEEPKIEEGFSSIHHIPFIPKFVTNKEKKLFKEY